MVILFLEWLTWFAMNKILNSLLFGKLIVVYEDVKVGR